jgi:flagellar protein FliS
MRDARSAYLETQVITAAPQKLRLMLIEGCMRFARQAGEALAAGSLEQFSESMDRARDIVTELISGIRPEPLPTNETARALYAFIFKSLAEAQLLKDPRKIEDAIRVLQEERETWLLVCELAPEPSPAAASFRQQEVLASEIEAAPLAPVSSFSLDA